MSLCAILATILTLLRLVCMRVVAGDSFHAGEKLTLDIVNSDEIEVTNQRCRFSSKMKALTVM